MCICFSHVKETFEIKIKCPSINYEWRQIDTSPYPDSIHHEYVKIGLTKPLTNLQKRRLKARNGNGIIHHPGKSTCRYTYIPKNILMYLKIFKTLLLLFLLFFLLALFDMQNLINENCHCLHFLYGHNKYLFHFIFITEDTFAI